MHLFYILGFYICFLLSTQQGRWSQAAASCSASALLRPGLQDTGAVEGRDREDGAREATGRLGTHPTSVPRNDRKAAVRRGSIFFVRSFVRPFFVYFFFSFEAVSEGVIE